jgi:MtN3 and saliva related transmembrane protein
MWPIIIETTFSLGLFINAALFIPQSMRLMKTKDASDVSLITFFGFFLIQFTIIAHGDLVHDTLLAYGTYLSVLTNGHVLYLIIYYRLKRRSQA